MHLWRLCAYIYVKRAQRVNLETFTSVIWQQRRILLDKTLADCMSHNAKPFHQVSQSKKNPQRVTTKFISHSLYGTNSPVGRSLNPRYLQTTAVCLSVHWRPHTVTHLPPLHTSTLPSLSDFPPISLISPVEQPSVSHIDLLCCLNWPICHSTLCSLKHTDLVH